VLLVLGVAGFLGAARASVVSGAGGESEHGMEQEQGSSPATGRGLLRPAEVGEGGREQGGVGGHQEPRPR